MRAVLSSVSYPALKALAAGLLGALAAISARAQEGPYLGGTPPGDGPVEVLIGFNLLNISDVNEQEETIDFEGAIYMEWMDPRLAYAPADVGMTSWVPGDYSRTPRRIYQGDFAVKELFEGWWLTLNMPNGIGDRAITNMAISIWPDGRVAYSEIFSAKAETPMDLRRFPFDKQDLEIFFHPFVYKRDEVVLIADDRLAQTWNQNLGVADWERRGVLMAERPVEIAYFDESKAEISEFVVTVQIKRRPIHLMVSIIFPLVVLVSLTWSVFWMDEESLSDRLNINFIGILSVVAYYFVLLDNVPEVDYLTLMDAFIIATFLVLAAGVVLAVSMERMRLGGREALGARVDRICRWAVPLGYAGITAILALVFF